MPKFTDAQILELMQAGATDADIAGMEAEDEGAPAESGGMGNALLAGGGLLAAGAAAYAAKKTGLGPIIGKTFDTLNNVRRQSMLTGLALPKSLLGNVGGAAMESIERGSVDPLKEMLRLPTNIRNAVAAFKQGGAYQGVPSSKWALPGRILGATDEAAQAALQRGGLTADESAKAMLQEPLGQGFDFMDNRLGNYLIPFRRTPFNQLKGGLETMSDWDGVGKTAANLTSLGLGAATGASTEGKTAPALGAAAMGRRGAPFLAGALAGKYLTGASKREAADVMQGVSPVSDYSITEGVAGPLNPMIPKPALYNLLFGSKK